VGHTGHIKQTFKTLPWFQRFIFPLPFAMKMIKISLWNQGIKTPVKLRFKNTN
jgi:hypothetical protein